MDMCLHRFQKHDNVWLCIAKTGDFGGGINEKIFVFWSADILFYIYVHALRNQQLTIMGMFKVWLHFWLKAMKIHILNLRQIIKYVQCNEHTQSLLQISGDTKV